MATLGDFVWHRGTLAGSALYLPEHFVQAFVSFQGLIRISTVTLPLVALLLPWMGRRGEPSFGMARLAAVVLALTAFGMTLALHQFQDEVFGNLIQSRILGETGRYSFNTATNIDGTGDILFYVLLGGLHALGLPAPLGALMLGGGFVAGFVYLVYLETFRRTRSFVWAWSIASAALLLPTVGGLAGSGWSTPLLVLLTWMSIVVWQSERWPWAFVLTGMFVIVRYDFAFYTAAIGALLVARCLFWGDRPWRRALCCYVASLVSIVAVLAFWRLYYGHFVPSCIVVKAGGFWEYLKWEVYRDWTISFLRDHWFLLTIIGVGIGRIARRELANALAWLVPSSLHAILVLAGGGDYMPGYRYHVILIIALIYLAVLSAEGAKQTLNAERTRMPGRRVLKVSAVALVVVSVATAQTTPWLWRGAKIVRTQVDDSSWGNEVGLEAMTASRITNHARTGRFFSWLTDGGKDRLASLEIASIFYFYAGPSLDILGFANREIALGPMSENPRGPWDKRCDPAVWERDRPDIIWLDTENGYQPRMMLGDGNQTQAVLSWSRHIWWTAPYFDSVYLNEHYRPRTTVLNDGLYIIWLVREDRAAVYDSRMEAAGFQRGKTWPPPKS